MTGKKGKRKSDEIQLEDAAEADDGTEGGSPGEHARSPGEPVRRQVQGVRPKAKAKSAANKAALPLERQMKQLLAQKTSAEMELHALLEGPPPRMDIEFREGVRRGEGRDFGVD